MKISADLVLVVSCAVAPPDFLYAVKKAFSLSAVSAIHVSTTARFRLLVSLFSVGRSMIISIVSLLTYRFEGGSKCVDPDIPMSDEFQSEVVAGRWEQNQRLLRQRIVSSQDSGLCVHAIIIGYLYLDLRPEWDIRPERQPVHSLVVWVLKPNVSGFTSPLYVLFVMDSALEDNVVICPDAVDLGSVCPVDLSGL